MTRIPRQVRLGNRLGCHIAPACNDGDFVPRETIERKIGQMCALRRRRKSCVGEDLHGRLMTYGKASYPSRAQRYVLSTCNQSYDHVH